METVKGFDNYEIDTEGNVRNKKRDKFLKPCIDNGGYSGIRLMKEGKRYYCLIHRLLALQFLDNPNNLEIVDHIDRNNQNNNLNNLRWVTRSQNNRNRECKGYSYDKRINKYRVRYNLNNKNIELGLFKNEADARNAYLETIKDL